MSTLLLSGFLPLLLLTWQHAGLTKQHQISLRINVSELIFQCEHQKVLNSTGNMVEEIIDQINMMEKVEIHFLYEKNYSTVGHVNETKTCTCEKRNASRVEAGTNKTQQECDPETSPTSPSEPQIPKGIIHMYIIPGLLVSSLFFLFCALVCLCRRNQRNAKGKSESKHVAEMNQLNTPQNEEVVYAKMKFEKTETKPAASEVVYTEIKSQQK